MERVREKLHSRTGASLLIALLFFLVAMTVGTVVLTAASANAGRVQKNRQEQQNYLAVASAAELVKEDFVGSPGGSFTDGYRKIVTETYYPATYDPEGNKISDSYTTRTTSYEKETATVENSRLLLELESVLDAIYFTTVPVETLRQSWDPTQDTELELHFDAADMPAAGSLAVSRTDDDTTGRRQYALTVVLGVKPEQAGAPLTCATAMSFAPVVTEQVRSDAPNVSGDTTIYVTHYITTVTWGSPVITRGAQP